MLTVLLNKNTSRRTNKLLSCSQIKTRNKTVGLGSNTGFCCKNGHNIPLSPNLTHPDNNGTCFIYYDANVKAIIQAYTNGAAGNSLDTTGVLLDLPSARNLSRSFSCHQEKVGENIRATVVKKMELALEMELKATIIHKESKEYYEQWLKSDKKTRKRFGLTVSYDMG